MKIEQHKEAFAEHLNNINKIIDEGLEKNQRNIGFNISQGSVELFSLFLHKPWIQIFHQGYDQTNNS